jgi:hypothetical protein
MLNRSASCLEKTDSRPIALSRKAIELGQAELALADTDTARGQVAWQPEPGRRHLVDEAGQAVAGIREEDAHREPWALVVVGLIRLIVVDNVPT